MHKRTDLSEEEIRLLTRWAAKKYVSLEEGAALYSLGLHNFQQLAKDAKATYKVGRRVLVNTEKFDEFMEMFQEDLD